MASLNAPSIDIKNALVEAGLGVFAATRDGGTPVIVNRKTSDGELVQLQKDGSAVGSIGTHAGYITMGNGDTSLIFDNTANTIEPFNQSDRTAEDAAITLGWSSNRFKDLYLSGGVYLGGTGADNLLDDYEKGTWTPTFAGLTIGNGTVSGTYTKIGRQVTVVFGFNCGSTTSVGTLGNITGLPFLSADIWTGYIKVHGVVFDSGSRWFEAVAALGNNSNTIFVPSTANLTSAISASNPMTWTTNDNLVFTATYTTT